MRQFLISLVIAFLTQIIGDLLLHYDKVLCIHRIRILIVCIIIEILKVPSSKIAGHIISFASHHDYAVIAASLRITALDSTIHYNCIVSSLRILKVLGARQT